MCVVAAARRFQRRLCLIPSPIPPTSLAVYRPLNTSLIPIHIYPTVLCVSTNASTPVPLLACLLICIGPRAASRHIHHAHEVAEYTHAERTPATNVLDTLEKNKIEHLSKSPLGVRVMMYRNVLCSSFHSNRLLG